MADDADPSFWSWRSVDLRRHLEDLEFDAYEGAKAREDRNAVFASAFELLTPVALEVLQDFNLHVLAGVGDITVQPLSHREGLGLFGTWECSWPEQRGARSRFDDSLIPPLQLQVFFPGNFTHGHLMIGRPFYEDQPVSCWLMQVTDESDAWRQRHALESICETQVHEMIFTANWRIIPPVIGDHAP
ncbi:MAG: hypothetical protein F2840_14410 [Actinobacteria bacterium]|nr:hypothetical protein [Actinomycetota bacterium]